MLTADGIMFYAYVRVGVSTNYRWRRKSPTFCGKSIDLVLQYQFVNHGMRHRRKKRSKKAKEMLDQSTSLRQASDRFVGSLAPFRMIGLESQIAIPSAAAAAIEFDESDASLQTTALAILTDRQGRH